jgi:hypothetical protein
MPSPTCASTSSSKLRQGRRHAELEAESARLHPQLLDRKRPLWKIHVFEGLAPGPNGERRVAMYTQLHHAAVDGQAAVALANALLDLTPEPRALELKPSRRRRSSELDMTEMLRGVIASQASKVAHIVRGLPSTVGTLKDAATDVVAHTPLLGGKARGRQPDAGAAHAASTCRSPKACLRQRHAAAARPEGLAARTAPPSTTWC